MAAATASFNVDDGETCVLCSSKYNRRRPPFCQCKHCSTTGRRQFYIVYLNSYKQTISLQNEGDCIAVLNNRRVAVSRQRTDMEILTY